MVALDLVGKRFGKWLVLKKVDSLNKHTMFLCRCDCGKEKICPGAELNKGRTKSCGCVHHRLKTKMYRDHPLYDVWKGMKARCYGINHRSYHIYGAKGVTVCQEWNDEFQPFYDWSIKNGYKQGLQIDKDIIAKELGVEANLYSPERCKWVLPVDNSHAKDCNKLNYEKAHDIRTSNLRAVELAKKYKVNKSTIERIKRNETWKQ